MYVTKITHEQSVTIPTGGFSNVKPGYVVEIALEKGDDVDAAAARATEIVENLLEAKINQVQESLIN